MTDPLSQWWRHPVVIRRYTGAGAIGDSYEDAETVVGFVQDGATLVAGSEGEQITSSAQVALPKGTAPVPLNSKVTLPPQFGERTLLVVATAVGDGAGLPTPDHLEIALR